MLPPPTRLCAMMLRRLIAMFASMSCDETLGEEALMATLSARLRVRRRLLGTVVLLSVLAACSGPSTVSTTTGEPTVGSSSAASSTSPTTGIASSTILPPSASAGFTKSSQFRPPIAFEVPPYWTVHEDTEGTFVLFAPSTKTAADGSPSAIYVLTHGMVTPAGCPNPIDTGERAADMVTTLRNLPGLVSTKPQAIAVAGLGGFVVELHVAPTWNKACVGTIPGVQLLHGLPPTEDPSFDSAIVLGGAAAVYLLDRPQGGVMAIEIDDQSGGNDLAGYRAVAETMRFAP
jgi:hypothetical protein